eukprot:scaffold3787_cov258-Pinguiococcus_pyrenoidosus.AAC.10
MTIPPGLREHAHCPVEEGLVWRTPLPLTETHPKKVRAPARFGAGDANEQFVLDKSFPLLTPLSSGARRRYGARAGLDGHALGPHRHCRVMRRLLLLLAALRAAVAGDPFCGAGDVCFAIG